MSLARRIVDVAVLLSPAASRAARAEQWRADVRDAGELDLRPTRLALGALTTAVLHRRSLHAAASPVPIRRTRVPGAVRVLVGLAFASLVAGEVASSELARFNGTSAVWVLGASGLVAFTVVPGALLLGAVLVSRRATPRRRAIGALLVLLLALRLGTVVVGEFRVGPDWLWIAVIATGVLATWFLVQGRRGPVWVLLALPALTLAVLEPQSLTWSENPDAAAPVLWAAVSTPVIGPFASALIAGIVSPRLDTGRSIEPTLVDRGV